MQQEYSCVLTDYFCRTVHPMATLCLSRRSPLLWKFVSKLTRPFCSQFHQFAPFWMGFKLPFAQKKSQPIERQAAAEDFIKKVPKLYFENPQNKSLNVDSGVLFHSASKNVNCIWHLMASRRYIFFDIEQFDVIQVTYHSGKDCQESGLLWFLKHYSTNWNNNVSFDSCKYFTSVKNFVIWKPIRL